GWHRPHRRPDWWCRERTCSRVCALLREKRATVKGDAYRPPQEDERHRGRVRCPRDALSRGRLRSREGAQDRDGRREVLPSQVVPQRAGGRAGLESEARLGRVLFDEEVPAGLFRGGIGVADRIVDREAEEGEVRAHAAAKDRELTI